MTKWRAVLVGTMAGGALAVGSLIPAHADPTVVTTPIGTITADGDQGTQTGHITADGNADNPAVLGGYVTVGNDGADGPAGACADDNGSNANAYNAQTNPGGSSSPTCQSAP